MVLDFHLPKQNQADRAPFGNKEGKPRPESCRLTLYTSIVWCIY